MTITIDLDPPILEPLERLAKGRGCSVEEMARTAISEYVCSAASANLFPALVKAVTDSFAENDELYRRLAK